MDEVHTATNQDVRRALANRRIRVLLRRVRETRHDPECFQEHAEAVLALRRWRRFLLSLP